MTSRFEQAYLNWFTSEIYNGQGEIVDLGSWLGSTTLSLAEGLATNRKRLAATHRIHAYDAFTWEEWMDTADAGVLSRRYQPGESFLDEFKRRTRRFADCIEIHNGDLRTIGWNGKPIELLVVDAMKSWELAQAILKDFYRRLIPGTGILFHQDFAHYYTYWIHLIQYRLREYFVVVSDLPESCATVFRLISAIPPEVLACAADPRPRGPGEIAAAFAHSRMLVTPAKRPLVDAAHMVCLAEYGLVSEASAVMDRVRGSFAAEDVEFERAAAVVRGRMGALTA